MTKNRIIEWLSFALLGLTTLAGWFTLPQAALLPQAWQPYIVLIGGVVLWGKNGVYLCLDWWDDGKLNKSYKLPLVVLGGLCLTMLCSCSNGMFLGLDKAAWGEVGKAAGNAALRAGGQAAAVEYGNRRAVNMEVTATK